MLPGLTVCATARQMHGRKALPLGCSLQTRSMATQDLATQAPGRDSQFTEQQA